MADDQPVFGTAGASSDVREKIEQAHALDWESRCKTIAERRAAGEDWDLLAPVKPRPALLVDPLNNDRLVLPRGKVGFLVAPGDTGKTYLMTSLAVACASGCNWLGESGFKVVNPGKVLLALGEEEEDELKRRLQWTVCAMAEENGFEKEAFARLVEKNMAALSLYGVDSTLVRPMNDTEITTPFYAKLKAILRAGGPWSAILFDPGVLFMGAEAEKDSAAANRFIVALRGLTTVDGSPSLIIAHHTTKAAEDEEKAAATALRGSGALKDGARWVATLYEQDNGSVVFKIVKNNYGSKKTTQDRILKRDEDTGTLSAESTRPPTGNGSGSTRRRSGGTKKNGSKYNSENYQDTNPENRYADGDERRSRTL